MLALILILFAGSSLDKISPEFRQEIESLSSAIHSPKFKQVVEDMSSADRLKVISWLKEQMTIPDNPRPVDETDLLIEFGDEAMIAKEAQFFPNSQFGGRSDLGGSIQPKVITALAPNMFVNEPYTFEINIDVGVIPKSFETTEAIREVLVRSPYFSKEVNQWAASWKYKDPTKLREVMRNWWNESKEGFYKGNYAAVQPGEPAPPQQTPPPESTATPASSLIPTPTPIPTETLTPTPATTATAAQPSPSNPFILPVTIGLAALFIGIVVFVFRKK